MPDSNQSPQIIKYSHSTYETNGASKASRTLL